MFLHCYVFPRKKDNPSCNISYRIRNNLRKIHHYILSIQFKYSKIYFLTDENQKRMYPLNPTVDRIIQGFTITHIEIIT